MLSSPESERRPSGSESAQNVAAVREQLRRLLAHPLFTNSKRYPVLLAYTVEQALDGNASELKERTIGMEAFGREPNYDVSVDPVVRMTAAEVRKRLIQYYYNPEHAGELVIELPVGSYVPIFREAGAPQNGPASQGVVARKNQTVLQEKAASPAVAPEGGPLGLTTRHWMLIAMAMLLAAVGGFALGRLKFPKQASNLERFWEPITATAGRVTYCLGEPAHSIDLRVKPPQFTAAGDLDVSDVITLARSIEPLVPQNGAFRVVRASDTEFTQLREGPFVLIGAYDNMWTLRIAEELPFGFEYDSATQERRIVDRKSGKQRAWTLQYDSPSGTLAEDYAIIARIHDHVTGQPGIILAGILAEGTEAAGELVTNPVYLDALLQKAPRNWDQLNLEAVIETHVIDGHPGPPTVLAVETW